MILGSDEIWMVIQLEDLTALSTVILTNELESFCFNVVDECRIHFVAMTVPLVDMVSTGIEFTSRTVLDLEHGWTTA